MKDLFKDHARVLEIALGKIRSSDPKIQKEGRELIKDQLKYMEVKVHLQGLNLDMLLRDKGNENASII